MQIDGLIKINPDFIAGDWFGHNTYHYHKHFSYTLQFLNFIGIPLNTGLISIEILLRILSLSIIYHLTALFNTRYKLIAFFLVLFLIVLESTKSVAGSYIFSDILQPSSFGSAFTLMGFWYFFRGKYLLSGLSIAFAGYMHINFLILGFIYLGLAHLFMGKQDLLKRSLLQFLPMLVVLLLALPFLIKMLDGENSVLATYIFQFFRSPHHYVPSYFLFDFVLFSGWSLLGIASLGLMDIEHHYKKSITALYSSLLIIILLATLLTTVVFIPQVSQLFFWRMAPFSILLSQILFISTVIQYLFSKTKPDINFIVLRSLLFISGFILINHWYISQYGLNSARLIFLAAFFALLKILFYQQLSKFKLSENAAIAYSSSLILLVLIYSFNTFFYERSTLINGFPGIEESELYQWSKQTRKTAVFLIPPHLQNFRLHAERAIVVDFKSTPVDPAGLIEWYERIKNVSGLKGEKFRNIIYRGYLELDHQRLSILKAKYNIDYVVLYKSKKRFTGNYPVVFENNKFIVLKLKLISKEKI